ncbi:MAG: YCF48-related protein [Geminicoccaceae bacterium]|nr:YCF48-related protein [Geminicoccaceae bacterium]
MRGRSILVPNWWRRLLLLGSLGVMVVGSAAAGPADRSSEIMPRAVRSLILDIERVGERVIAVGERGHILISDDGRSFRQVRAPVRSTLTALASGFVPGSIFAVGHDGVVLKSIDGGLTWALVFSSPEEQRPLLDIVALDERTVLAVGAYGWLLRSEDGGASWSAHSIDDDEPHLNGLAVGRDGTLLIAAEFGLTFRSADQGMTFERQELPYDGSFFGALRLDGGWLVFGLEGRIFRRDDGSSGWRQVEAPAVTALLAGHRLSNGRVLLAGLEGALLTSQSEPRFTLRRDPERLGIADVLELPDGSLLLAGENGLRRMSDPSDPTSIEPLPAPPR